MTPEDRYAKLNVTLVTLETFSANLQALMQGYSGGQTAHELNIILNQVEQISQKLENLRDNISRH